MGLASLPDDILLHIASTLSVRDILALRQTCRVLHAFGSTDYLWHRLAERTELLLDIPVDTPKAQLHAEELQRVAIRAIRLQLNWRRPSSRIKRTTSLETTSDALFDFMYLVPGGKWLLTVQGHSRHFEHRSYTNVSLWSLVNMQRPHCVIQFELTGKHRDTSLTMRNGSTATFVVALHDGPQDFIEIRTFAIDESVNVYDTLSPSPPVLVSRRLNIPPIPGETPATLLLEAVSVYDTMLMATVAKIVPGQEITSRIMIADTDFGPARWMQAQALQPLNLPQARLQDRRVVVFGRVDKDFVVRVYELPPTISRGRCGGSHKICQCSPASQKVDQEEADVPWGPMLQQLQLPLGTGLVDSIYVPSQFTSCLTVFVVDDHIENRPIGRILRFTLDEKEWSTKSAVQSARIFLPVDTSVRLVGVGVTGCRAVWMEHSLETTRSRLMKMEFGKNSKGEMEMFHGVLLPPDPPLPFSTDACHMLAFDEATGRLCLGLWDGGLHVVDFL